VREVLEYAPHTLTRLELLVLVSLAESASDRDRTTYGSQSAATVIAHRVRSSPATVRNALGALRQRALIKPVHAQAHRGRAQQYVITELHEYHRDT
jgi:DNA-binding MarR family transcriptional regulator